jgi:formylglycine-generating enzyme required for sulfatase activity
VAELAPKVAPELVSICEKAMARSLEQRYATMTELADDLRAYLEMRVVQAHRTGPIVEFKKWVRRNKKTAAGLLIVFGVISAAGFAVAASERARARESETRADIGESTGLLGTIDELGPVHPASIERHDAWLARARHLVGTIPVREAEQAERSKRADDRKPRAAGLKARLELAEARDKVKDLEKGLSVAPDQDVAQQIFPEEIRWRRMRLAGLEAEQDNEPILIFADRKLQEEADQGHKLLRGLKALQRRLPVVERRATLARELRQRTIDLESDAWSAAVAAIRDTVQCPLYGGLVIEPQLGLVPLRRDPQSGLYEFWHVLSGDKPLLDEKGSWIVGPSTGIVLVLIPGGDFRMGAQSSSRKEARFDPRAEAREALRSARLDPFFLSKYEMTQGQWLLLTDEHPSRLASPTGFELTPRVSRSNPVENVGWLDCELVLTRFGLSLPTEMQWECAARGGTELPYLTSKNFVDIHAQVNWFDRTAAAAADTEPIELDDGFGGHVRVDTFGPNSFGLYNVLGNVSEWCRDAYADKSDEPKLNDGDGEIVVSASSGLRPIRGGSFKDYPAALRVSARQGGSVRVIITDVGLRPARKLDR